MSMEIYIKSGEGEVGTVEPYTGKVSVRAIKARLTREQCKGDRWAKVLVDDGSGMVETTPEAIVWSFGKAG